MRCRFAFLIALEYAAIAAVLIFVGLELRDRWEGEKVPETARPGTGVQMLSPANAVFLPFEETLPEVVARPVLPAGRPPDLAMLSGWYAGPYDRFLDSEGDWISGESYEFCVEADGQWACAAVVHSCVARVRRSRGHVILANGRLLFEVDDLDGNPTHRACAVLPVYWGERLYLLGPGDVARFCDSVNWGDEPRRAVRMLPRVTYVRAPHYPSYQGGSVDAQVGDGPPLLPEAVSTWILRAPVEGRLTETLPDRTWKADIGTGQGVFRGMTLRARADGSEFRVVEVGSDSCVVRADKDPGSSGAAGTAIWSDARGANLRR